MIEKLFAAVVLTVCIVLMLRLVLGARRRARFDAAARRAWYGTRHAFSSFYRRRGQRREAERVADEAIRRARGSAGRRNGDGSGEGKGDEAGEWDGNVYKPKSFKKPRKLH